MWAWILRLVPWAGRLVPFVAGYGRIALVASVVGGTFLAGYKVADWRFRASLASAAESSHEMYVLATRQGYILGQRLEAKREKNRVVYRTIREVRTQYIDRPVYSGDCVDDAGLRNLNHALAGTAPAPGERDRAVPAAGAAGR